MAHCREIADLVKEVRRQGFVVTQGRNTHYKIKKDGRTIATLPHTPGGGGNAVKQIIRRETKKLIANGFRGELTW